MQEGEQVTMKYTGLHITLSTQQIEQTKDEIAEHPDHHSVEVHVELDGRAIEMSYDEFLKRLGFVDEAEVAKALGALV